MQQETNFVNMLQAKILEDKVVSQDASINALRRKCDEYCDEVKRLKREVRITESRKNVSTLYLKLYFQFQVDFKDGKIQQYGVEKNREKRANQKMAVKTEKLEKEKENVTKEKIQIEVRRDLLLSWNMRDTGR